MHRIIFISNRSFNSSFFAITKASSYLALASTLAIATILMNTEKLPKDSGAYILVAIGVTINGSNCASKFADPNFKILLIKIQPISYDDCYIYPCIGKLNTCLAKREATG